MEVHNEHAKISLMNGSPSSLGPVRNWSLVSLHQGFAALAASQPDAPAILAAGSWACSYAELERRSSRLAWQLQARGLVRGEAVGVLVQRSGQLPLAFLAILKAGGVYVPLVADLPEQRLSSMVQQAGIRQLLLLDDLEAPEALGQLLGNEALIRPGALAADPDAADFQPCAVGPEDLAAILFTSGSTGQPKGVMIRHQAVVNMALGHVEAHAITPADRVLLATSPGFILGFRELCMPLLAGAAFVPVSRELLDAPARLLELMSRERVSIALFTPSYLRLLGGAVPTGLRCILTAGERPNADDARHYARHLAYWNMHGATEVCGTICMLQVDPAGSGPLPSGRPFTNTAVYLLDEDGQEVAPGATGEICVVGTGVSPGYLGQPELTARYFTDTPYGRAYRTHDLGRWNAEGCLETLGRADDMVKVSGQSVSLGEIEAALMRHHLVSRAAARAEDGRLLAYVESPRRAAAEAEDWRAYLALSLPPYMLPARVLVLERMPINSAGKIDRQALVQLQLPGAAAPQGRPPRGEREQLVARTWEALLGFAPIMAGDNFFAVGGTSLLAIAVSQQLQAAGYGVAVQDVLAALTVEALAARMQPLLPAAASAEASAGPATPEQEDFWVAAQLGLPPGAAHIVQVFTLGVPLASRGEPLDFAWQALLARHGALRTGFRRAPGGELQWYTLEAGALPASARLQRERLPAAAARDYLARQAGTAFDLQAPPLVRAGLLELQPEVGEGEGGRCLFWYVLHHSVVDGVSARRLESELLALLAGQSLPPAAHGIQLASQAARTYRESAQAELDRAFWGQRLDSLVQEGGAAFAGQALERPGPETSAAEEIGGECLKPGEVAALRELAQARGIGLHALLLGLLGLELGRRSGHRELLLGSGISMRPAGAEDCIGHFVHVLPVCLEWDPEAELGALLQHTQRALTGTVTHAGYPASQILREFRQRHPLVLAPSRQSLFQLALTAVQASGGETAGLSLEPLAFPGEPLPPAAGLDLSFSHELLPDGGLRLSLRWNPDSCSPRSAAAWLAALADWARWLAAEPAHADQPAPALLPAEARCLAAWEWGETRPRPGPTLDRLWAARVAAEPRALALLAGGEVDRAGLDARANGIARALLEQGAGRGTVVAVLADDPAGLPAAVLGIWKAGACYLPLAQTLPPARLALMARDAGARHLLITGPGPVPAALAQVCPLQLQAADCPASGAMPPLPLGPAAAMDDAYIIYTSGTTGQPKGVPVSHRSYINALAGTLERIGQVPGDRIALAAVPTFDASLWELGLGLLGGMPLVPVSQELREDPWALKDYYRRQGVTLAFHTPSYLRISQQQPFTGLRVLLTGGEAPSHADARQLQGQLDLWNCYGPTEATILVAMGQVCGDAPHERPLSIGRPLPNTRISLRHADGRPVPPGCVGELWLAGEGLARGYLNRPEQSRESFVDTGEGRFYRSGDYGCWTPGGALEIHGRVDQQIKINGQRVEPGEVERLLADFPGVVTALVLPDPGGPGEGAGQALRAFVVPAQDAPWTPEACLAWLAEQLPAHMLPASVTPVAAIPLGPNGKADGAALLRLAAAERARLRPLQTPLDPFEARVAGVWQEILGQPVGRQDNFFALGGDSLRAVLLAHRLAAVLGQPVPARTLFAAPTLGAFAARVLALQEDSSPGIALAPDLATEGEQEFWVAEQAGLDTRAFIMPIHQLWLGEQLAPVRWQAAWAALVARHGALRSCFAEDGAGQLRHRTLAQLEAPLEWARVADAGAARAHVLARQGEALDMGQAPLWRAGVVEEEGGRAHFWLAMHHAIGDGRSLGVLLAELETLLAGQPLPAEAGDYAALSRREQRYLASPQRARDETYWRGQLARLSPACGAEWALDFPRSAQARPGSHRFQVRLDGRLSAGLLTLARQHEASLHALLLTALGLEAGRRSGRGELLLGTTAALSETAEEGRIPGYGVNMLPLGLVLDGEDFGSRLRHTQAVLAAALAHGAYPFARIYREFWAQRPELRDPLRYPLFDLAVTENPARPGRADCRFTLPPLGEGELAYERNDHSPGQDMVLIHELLPDGSLLLAWHVNAALYARDTAAFWFTSLLAGLRWLGEVPARAAEPLPELWPEEADRLAAWSRGAQRPRPDLGFHQLFEALLARPGQGERPAVLTLAGSQSYQELEAAANAIAHALLQGGLERGQVVGVLSGRSPRLPAAVLGIWKAGGVYLPLAADLPPERQAFMARDAALARLLLLDGLPLPGALAQCLEEGAVLRPEALPAGFLQRHGGAPGLATAGAELAYILYTSGSTGQPKGTLVTHASYVNTVLGVVEQLGLGVEDRCLMFASPSFDVSLSDLGVPLACGAALCPASEEIIAAPGRFLDFLARLRITLADITPTYLRLFAAEQLPRTLRIIVTGGEPPLPADVARLGLRLAYYNAYGPTENCITSTMGRLHGSGVGSDAESGSLTAGRPLPNTTVQVRAADGRLLPPGALGELWLGGVGLARGYLQRPREEAQAFVSSPAGRHYRSGDLGRWRGNGEIEIAGRLDGQVKLNGIRIEPGEIEAALEAHPAIRQAVVLLDTQPGGAEALWAWVCPAAPGVLPEEAEWRAFLASRLPPWMMPAGLLALPALPLTLSGKVDRAALGQRLAAGRPASGPSRRTPPRDGLEQALAAIWAELLGRESVFREDNFFSLGGHSLLAIAVAHRLERQLGQPVAARELFAAPVLADFAARLEGLEPEAPLLAESELATEGQGEFWTAEQAGFPTGSFHLKLTLAVPGDCPGDETWQRAWAALVARHEALRTGFGEDARGRLVRRLTGTVPALEMGRPEHRSGALALIRAAQEAPLSMASPCLWRAGLARPADGSAPLFWLVLHHAVGDGLSLAILTGELAELLQERALPPPGESPGRAAAREQAYLASPAAQADAAYWAESLNQLLEQAPQALDEWPLDRPRPASRQALAEAGSHCWQVDLDAATAAALGALARQQGISLHALMLALLGIEVRRRTGRQGFLLGTAASSRHGAAQAGSIGYFVNMLPLARMPAPAATLAQVLAAMQESLARGLGHGRYPFARIYADFRRARGAGAGAQGSRYPLFDMGVTENPPVVPAQAGRFGFQPLQAPDVAQSGAPLEQPDYSLRHGGPAQDMLLIHEARPDGGLRLSWHVSAALLSRNHARAWFDGLRAWAAFLATPGVPLDEPPPALLPEERRWLAACQQGPRRSWPEATLAARFAGLARQQPEAPAIVGDAGERSYAQVDRAASALAQVLLDQGLARGEPVGVFTRRSPLLPEVVLAIWKAGGCYLPLAAELPAGRLAFMARDAGIRLLLALDGLSPPAELAALATVLRPELLDLPAQARVEQSRPEDPAYIIYTSGSTGEPKGVELLHAGLLNLGLAGAETLGLVAADRATLLFSPSFDGWIGDLAFAWAAGAALVPFRREEMDDIPGLLDKFTRQGVSVAAMPPSYLRLLGQAELPGVRLLMTAGEAPWAEDVRHYGARLRYVNGYGPTENTVGVTLGFLAPGAEEFSTGRPLANTQVLVTDCDGAWLPPGCTGEIRLAGAGLARGYLKRPELNAASFIDTPTGRQYRTGDLGRWTPDGELLVLGRADTQVKLRGQRVELGEIEHRLGAWPGVSQAVAVAERQPDGSATLWAFVTLEAGCPEPEPSRWAAHLGAGLPAWMLPAAVFRVERMPLTPAGKIDRKALLAQERRPLAPGLEAGGRTPPRGPVETRVAALWSALFEGRAVAREDDFFALGGDSLRAIAVINQLRQDYVCQVNDLYEQPLLADFARRCRPRAGQLHSLLATRLQGDDPARLAAAREQALAPLRAAYAERNQAWAALDLGLRRAWGHVLLSGASGYLGIYLLRELLGQPGLQVSALVRAPDEAAARARLDALWRHYFAAPLPGPEAGLRVLAGDLRQPDLGLGAGQGDALARTLDGIFHCAALVSHVGHYEDFHAANVLATAHLLQLARRAQAEFHCVSTLSVAGRARPGPPRHFSEDDPPGSGEANYYVRSKQEAEALVIEARQWLPNACIHRVGNIAFASRGGRLQRGIENNAFFRQLVTFLQLGAVPDDVRAALCHVDRVAGAIVALAGTAALEHCNHHVETSRPETLADLVAPLAGRLRLGPLHGLLEDLLAAGDPAQAGLLGETLENFGLLARHDQGARLESAVIACDRTQALLERLGVSWPALPSAGRQALLEAACRAAGLAGFPQERTRMPC